MGYFQKLASNFVRVNIEAIMPRIADILIDDGLIDVEWGQQ